MDNRSGSELYASRLRSVFVRDSDAIKALLDVHAQPKPRILDVTHNKGKMWKGVEADLTRMDIDPGLLVDGFIDQVGDCRNLPYPDESFDVIAFDPPHLPNANATNDRLTGHADVYGVRVQADERKGDNVTAMFLPFLCEARRVLRPEGIVLAKLADFVHNHKYQWQHVDFVNAARSIEGFVACESAIVAHPASGNLQSSKWERVFHLRRAHTHWVVARKGRCERQVAHNEQSRERGE